MLQSMEGLERLYGELHEMLTGAESARQQRDRNDEAERMARERQLDQAKKALDDFRQKWRGFYAWASAQRQQFARARSTDYRFQSSEPDDLKNEIQQLINGRSRCPSAADRQMMGEQIATALCAVCNAIEAQERALDQRVRAMPTTTIAGYVPAGLSLDASKLRDLYTGCEAWLAQTSAGNPAGDALQLWGFQAMPFPVPVTQRRMMPRLTGLPQGLPESWPFDVAENAGVIYLPVAMPRLVYIGAQNRRSAKAAAAWCLQAAVNRFARDLASGNMPRWHTVIVDTTTLYDTSIGFFRSVSGEVASSLAASACHSIQEANDTLEQLWALAHTESADRLLILRGALEEVSADSLRRLVKNAEDLRLQIVVIDDSGKTKPPEYMVAGSAAVYTGVDETLTREDGGRLLMLTPCTTPDEAQIDAALERLRKPSIYNYPMPDFASIHYDPDDRELRLPMGVTDSGEVVYYDTHDNAREKGGGGNAGFVVGVSGSGKSTLLHNLIAGVITRYHPDAVELWLADFKMKEFARYAVHRPPHVRYVLLDESEDMVISLIDKLTDEMKRRQRIIAAAGAEWYQDPRIQPRLPLLFCIIDEFSRMSQALSGNRDYRVKLQNLFTQARDQGIRLLLSSQFYTAGVEALNDMSKGQIGIRLAMCTTDKAEMRATLALPTAPTDEQAEQIATLPRYKLLMRKGRELVRLNVYNQNAEATRGLYGLIDRLNARMTVNEKPTGDDPWHCADKHMLFVSGDEELLETFEQSVPRAEKRRDGAMQLWLGRPRRLETSSAIVLHRQDNENLLLCADPREEVQRIGMLSVVRSMLLSAQMQGARTFLWANSPDEDMRAQWGDSLVSDFQTMNAQAAQLERELDEGRMTDTLLIVIDPVALLGAKRRKALKERLRPKRTEPAQETSSVFGGGSLFGGFGQRDSVPANEPDDPMARLRAIADRMSASASLFDDTPKPQDDERSMEDRLCYLLAAGAEEGLRVAYVVPEVKQLYASDLLPDTGSRMDGKLDFFRHQLTFRMAESDYEAPLKMRSRRQLVESLENCFLYTEGLRIVMREPYRLPARGEAT